jgi:hypothetical protein
MELTLMMEHEQLSAGTDPESLCAQSWRVRGRVPSLSSPAAVNS